ncbi:MAG: YidC/Oxa1 family membrane protein insertase [candidate division SR1 bacterium]|nr:YidC/Oxa1 family membrane protein insertase [candidate division SR1 bacterium]
MNIFSLLFTQILYRPIFNLLVVFLAIFGGNLGISIILLTLIVRFAMIKTTLAGNDMQKGMGALQPKLAEIQEKYKDDPKRVSAETMKVFKTDGKGAFKGCLMMLIQIPVFIGLYRVVRRISNNQVPAERLYSFFHGFGVQYLDPAHINHHFLGMDLLATKNIGLTIAAAIFTYLQTKFTTLAKPATPTVPGQKAPDMGKMMGFMNIFLVFMIASFVYTMNAAVGLYIVTTTLFSVVQYGWQ